MIKILYSVFDNKDQLLLANTTLYNTEREAIEDLRTLHSRLLKKPNIKIIEYTKDKLKFVDVPKTKTEKNEIHIFQILKGSDEKMLNVKERMKELENKYELENILYCFGDYSNGYICDIITEVCDNNVDIYTYNLWDWAKDNEYYIEEAIKEFGIDSNNFSLTQLFQQGQYYYYQEICYKHLDDIIEYLILSNLDVEEIKATVYDEILNISGQEDNNARIEDYIEEIEELIQENN